MNEIIYTHIAICAAVVVDKIADWCHARGEIALSFCLTITKRDCFILETASKGFTSMKLTPLVVRKRR